MRLTEGETGNTIQIGRSYTMRGTVTTPVTGCTMDMKEYLEKQKREIEVHKWIESEKAGRDLGAEAVIHWIEHHADAFSDHFLASRCDATRDSAEKGTV
jgi:hypothetical protein